MKKILSIFTVAAMSLSLAGCSDWLEPEIIGGGDPVKGGSFSGQHSSEESNAYWAAIRAFKQSDHAISFGWYASWTPPENDAFGKTGNSLTGLPDSMDMVTLWGWTEPLNTANEIRQTDLRIAREERGLKVLFCHMCNNLGMYITPAKAEDDERDNLEYWQEYWKVEELGWLEACYRYGLAFGQWILDSGFDGIDLDFEPNFGHTGNLASHNDRMQKFIEGLGQYLGPNVRKEGETVFTHGKVLMVDGEPQTLNSVCGKYIDYYNIQSYSISGSTGTPSTLSDSSLDSRFRNLINKFGSGTECNESNEEIHRKVIWTDNLENVDLHNGGWTYNRRNGEQTRSLRGFALWHYPGCEDVRTGGAGAFKFEGCINRAPADDPAFAGQWGYFRQMIQALNPAWTADDDADNGEDNGEDEQ